MWYKGPNEDRNVAVQFIFTSHNAGDALVVSTLEYILPLLPVQN